MFLIPLPFLHSSAFHLLPLVIGPLSVFHRSYEMIASAFITDRGIRTSLEAFSVC